MPQLMYFMYICCISYINFSFKQIPVMQPSLFFRFHPHPFHQKLISVGQINNVKCTFCLFVCFAEIKGKVYLQLQGHGQVFKKKQE